jgi:DNA-directed RNA polymerase specialized sigma24 family protein
MERRASRIEPEHEDDDLDAVRAGDSDAFGRLVEPHRRDMHAHCYRMLGSVQDADDALQEALLGAWSGLHGFEGRSSLRSWLYRIATHSCYRLSAKRPRRLLAVEHGPPRSSVHDLGMPVTESVFLEPYPDTELADETGFTMPPLTAWFDGVADVRRFVTERLFETPWRLVPIGANGQLAFACYQGDEAGGPFRLGAINVLTLRGREIVELSGFVDAKRPPTVRSAGRAAGPTQGIRRRPMSSRGLLDSYRP